MWKKLGLPKVVPYLGAAAFLVEVQAAVHVHVARQGTATVSGSTPEMTLLPLWTFTNDDSFTAIQCEPLNLEWFWQGPDVNATLTATNVGISQSKTPPLMSSSGVQASAVPYTTGSSTIKKIDEVDPSEQGYTWSKVNVPSGWYIINATIPSYTFLASSAPFYVYSGIDSSCLSTTSSSQIPASTSSLVPIIPAPVSGASSNSTMIGAIVGACVGAVAVVAGIFLIWFCYRKRSVARANGSTNPNLAHRFSGLGSTDSRSVFAGNQTPRSRHRHHTSSFGTSITLASEDGLGTEKGSIMDSPSVLGDDAVALSSLPALAQQHSNGRTYSAASSIGKGFSSTDLSGNPPISNRTSLESATYPPTSPIRNSSQYALDKHVSSHSQSSVSRHHHEASRSQLDLHSDPSRKSNRQSVGKRRKPVPTYEPTDNVHSPVSPSSPVPPVPYSPSSPSPSPVPDILSTSPSPSSMGHYATRNRSVQELARPELAHKSSFGPGTQQMHYLIPDMPMSQGG